MKQPKARTRQCPICGADISNRAAQARYCGQPCTQKAYRQRQGRSIEPKPSPCQQCGTQFQPATSRARFCSDACRHKAWKSNRGDQPRD